MLFIFRCITITAQYLIFSGDSLHRLLFLPVAFIVRGMTYFFTYKTFVIQEKLPLQGDEKSNLYDRVCEYILYY